MKWPGQCSVNSSGLICTITWVGTAAVIIPAGPVGPQGQDDGRVCSICGVMGARNLVAGILGPRAHWGKDEEIEEKRIGIWGYLFHAWLFVHRLSPSP